MSDTPSHLLSPSHPDFLLDDYPLYNLNRTSATYTAEMSSILKSISMDQPRWRVLMLLDDKNPSTVSELSRRSVTKMSTITRILIRMESQGLVTKTPFHGDNRVTNISITDKGQEVVSDLRKISARIYERAFQGFSEKQIGEFVHTLKLVRENLTKSPYLD